MRWLLVLLAISACRSQSSSPAPAPPSPARIAVVPPPQPTLVPEPVLVEAPPWVDPDEPQIGGIVGTLVEKNGEPLPGAVLTITSDSIAPYAVITEENGTYIIDELPPDDYLVTIYYIETTQEHHVTVGDELVELDATIDLDPPPTIFGCGSSLENRYLVDGIDTTGLTFGE